MSSQRNTTSAEAQTFDVIIAGAGVAGCSAALFLLRQGYRVCLLHRPQNLLYKPGESLPPVANKLLRELDVWDAFVAQQHLPCYGNRSLWGAAQVHTEDFLKSPFGQGWHINRVAFEEMLLQAAAHHGAAVFTAGRHSRVQAPAPAWTIQLDGQTVHAPFLMDASGRNSSFARLRKMTRSSKDKQVALYGFFQHVSHPGQFSFIETAPSGWWYTAPLPGAALAVMFFTIPQALPEDMPAESMLQHLLKGNAPLRKLAGDAPPAVAGLCDAGSSRAAAVHDGNYAAIGDAALTFDPIASHGLVMAMTTARDAAACFHRHSNGDANAFDSYSEMIGQVFTHYEQERKRIYLAEQRWKENIYWISRHQL